MISNTNLIRDNVLKSTLREQIIKVAQVIHYTPVVSDRINQLTVQITDQEHVLEQLKEKHSVRLQEMARQKQTLKHQLQAKMFLKMTQQQALSEQMRLLQQNCHLIRQNKLKLTETKTTSNRLTNELEELEVHQTQAEQQIQRLQLKQIYDNKVQKEEQQTVKQLLMLIEAKRNQISKQLQLITILNDQVNLKQQHIKALKEQTNDIQVSIARTLPQLQSTKNQKYQLQAQKHKINQNISQISKKNSQLTSKINQNTALFQSNKQTSAEITTNISSLIEQSNQLNEKVIKTREHVLHLNTLKNNQKLINQQIKIKVRQLMKIVIDNQSNK